MPVAVQAETLPTLDLRQFDAGGGERLSLLRELRTAARNVGFFYLVGHGIEDSLIRDVLSVSRRFFALSEKDKLAIEMVNSPHFRGYNRAGYEHTRGKPDWREQVDIGPERPALPFDPAAPPWTRLQGPNQWPAAFPEFKLILLAYQEETTALALRVLRAFAAALEQPEDVFAPIYTPAPNPLIKIIRYPGRAADESDQGVGAHKDLGFVTLLLQDKQAGLQVQAEDGGWIDAPPVPGAFVVNIGEILRNGLQRLFARQRPSRGLADGGNGSPVRRAFPRCASRCDCAPPLAVAAPRGASARGHARSGQSALSRRRSELSQEPAAVPSRRRAPPLRGPDRPGFRRFGAGFGLLNPTLKPQIPGKARENF